jgi:hypothetical protein
MTKPDTRDNSFDGMQHLAAGESGDGALHADNLEDNPICAISYDASVPCLVVQWRGPAKSSQIRYIHECLIRLIEKHQVSKILGDDAALRRIQAVDQQWIVSDWMPRAIAAGLRTAASNKPRGRSAQASIKRILSAVPAGLAIRSFESLQEAKGWLGGVYRAGTYRIQYHRFKRGGEPISTFVFWSHQPSIGYFMEMARVALRSFWKADDGSLQPIIPRQRLPELIVITSEAGDEICRWSLEDEMRWLDKTPRPVVSNPSVSATR